MLKIPITRGKRRSSGEAQLVAGGGKREYAKIHREKKKQKKSEKKKRKKRQKRTIEQPTQGTMDLASAS
jgi:hypothetical protein